MVIELYWKHAPNTCRNFFELARKGYYNDVEFHKLIKARVPKRMRMPMNDGLTYYGGLFRTWYYKAAIRQAPVVVARPSMGIGGHQKRLTT